MKLSRAKIARLLKTGNQSRKNKKNRERRSKSLHAFKEDELILMPNIQKQAQAGGTVGERQAQQMQAQQMQAHIGGTVGVRDKRRARSANNKKKTLNLRFKTMKKKKRAEQENTGEQAYTVEQAEAVGQAEGGAGPARVEIVYNFFKAVLYGHLYYLIDVENIGRLVHFLNSSEGENYKDLLTGEKTPGSPAVVPVLQTPPILPASQGAPPPPPPRSSQSQNVYNPQLGEYIGVKPYEEHVPVSEPIYENVQGGQNGGASDTAIDNPVEFLKSLIEDNSNNPQENPNGNLVNFIKLMTDASANPIDIDDGVKIKNEFRDTLESTVKLDTGSSVVVNLQNLNVLKKIQFVYEKISLEDFYRSSNSSGSSKIWRLKTEIQLPTNSQEKFTKATSDLQDLIKTYTEMLKTGDTAGKNQLLFNNLNRIMNPVPGRFKLQIVRKDTIKEDVIYLEKALIRKSPKIIGITSRPPPDQVAILTEFLAKAGTPLRVMYSGSDSSPLKKFLDDRGAVGSGQSGRAINNIFELLVYTTTKIIPLANRRIKGEEEAKDAELNKKAKDAENAKIAKNNKDAQLILDAVNTIVAKALEIKQYSEDENGGSEEQEGGAGYTFKAEYDGLLAEIETAKRVLTSDEIADANAADANALAAAKLGVKLDADNPDEFDGGAGPGTDDDVTNANDTNDDAKPAETNKMQPLVIKDVAVAKSLKKFDAAYVALKAVVVANNADASPADNADNAVDNTVAIAKKQEEIEALNNKKATYEELRQSTFTIKNDIKVADETKTAAAKAAASATPATPFDSKPFDTKFEGLNKDLIAIQKQMDDLRGNDSEENYFKVINAEIEKATKEIAALEKSAAPAAATSAVDAKKLADIDAKIAKLNEEQDKITDLVKKKQQLISDISGTEKAIDANDPTTQADLLATLQSKNQERTQVDAEIKSKIGKSSEELQAEIEQAQTDKETLENENPVEQVKKAPATATGKSDIKTLAASLYDSAVILETAVKAAVEKINPSVKAEVKPPPAAEKAGPPPSSALNSDFANQLNELKKQMAENQAAAAADKDKNVKASIEAIMDDPYLYGQTLRLKVHVPPEQLFAMAAPTGSDLENWLKSFAVDTITQEEYNKVAQLSDTLKDETGKATSFGEKIKALEKASNKYKASKKTAPGAAGVAPVAGVGAAEPVVAVPNAAVAAAGPNAAPVVAANAVPVVEKKVGGALSSEEKKKRVDAINAELDPKKKEKLQEEYDTEMLGPQKPASETDASEKPDANATGASEKPSANATGASTTPESTSETESTSPATENKGTAPEDTGTTPENKGPAPGSGSPPDADKAALVLAWDELWGLIESYKEHLADFEKDLKQKKAVADEKNKVAVGGEQAQAGSVQAGGDPTPEQIQQAFAALKTIPKEDQDALLALAADPKTMPALMSALNGDSNAGITLGLKNAPLISRLLLNPEIQKLVISLKRGVLPGNTAAKKGQLISQGVGASTAEVAPAQSVGAPAQSVVAVVEPAAVAEPAAVVEPAPAQLQAEAEAQALKTAEDAKAAELKTAKETALKAAAEKAAPKSTGKATETAEAKGKTVNNTIELAMHTLVQTALELLLRTYKDYIEAGGKNQLNSQAGGGVPTDDEIAAQAQELAAGTPLAGKLTPTLIEDMTALKEKLKTEKDQKVAMKEIGEFLKKHLELVTNITQFGKEFAIKIKDASDEQKFTIANELVLKILGIDLTEDQKNQLQLAINVLNMIEKKDQERIIEIASNPKNINALIEFLILGKIPAGRLASVGLNPKNLLLANRLRKLMENPEFKEALTKLNASLGSQTPGEVTIIDSNDSSEGNEGEGEEGKEGEEEKEEKEKGNKGEGDKGNKEEKEKEKGEEGNKGEEEKTANAAAAASATPAASAASANQNTTATTYDTTVDEILKTMTAALDELLKSSGTVPTEEEEDTPTVEMGPGQPSEEMQPVPPSEEGEEKPPQGGAKSRKNKKRYTKNKRNKNKHKKGTKKNGKKSTRRKSKKN